MSQILLRTLTKKSTIGFGRFKNTTVGNLITQRNYEALISIYYKLELINFSPEVLSELSIEGDLLIAKPGRDVVKYNRIHESLCRQLREIKGLHDAGVHSINPMNNYKKRASVIRGIKEQSKILNRQKIQRT